MPTCSLHLQWNINNYTLLAILQTKELINSHQLSIKMERRNIYYAYIVSGATMLTIVLGIVITIITCAVYKNKNGGYENIQ